MLSTLQRNNIGSAFDILDFNRDGTIEREDMTGIATAIGNGLGLDEGTSAREALTTSLSTLWEQIRVNADADGDGRVSREEYITAVGNGLIDDPGFLAALRGVAAAEFDALDTDGNGTLSREELVRLYESAGLAADVAQGAFEQIDSDGDGRVSRDEWLTAFLAVYVNDDPAAVGSNFLGQAR